MKLKWEYDFKEVIDFCEKIGDPHTSETYLMTATQEIAKLLHKNLLEYTPVKTGNLRKMWSAGDNLLFTVEKLKTCYKVTLVNAARTGGKRGYKYGNSVENGHPSPNGGWVMGKFFVKKSIVELGNSKELQAIILKELREWFRRCSRGK